jgi:sugar O-acyltransferase (sialic acid O-acetyltransferase NeuD family)
MKPIGNITSKNKLLIIGASGHGKVVADIAMKMNRWQHIDFLDDNENIKSVLGIDVIGKSNDAFTYISDYEIFVAIGNSKTRERILTPIENAGADIPILIHPSVIIGEEVNIAVGTVIMAGVIVNCCSTIGKGCIINTGAIIEHDNIIDDYVHICSGTHLAGIVSIGKGSWIGVGSVVRNNINITGGCMIGAGAVVVRDITEAGTYVGVPARRV